MRPLPLGASRWLNAAHALLILATACLAACASAPPISVGASQGGAPLGTLAVSTPAFGQQSLRPTTCHSGERDYFLGFDLGDDTSGVVTRLIIDPATGPVIRVFAVDAPYDKTVLFRGPQCRVLHFSLESTGWRINRADELNVSLDVDCRLPSGESIVGKAATTDCR